jgi:hypothetical protein
MNTRRAILLAAVGGTFLILAVLVLWEFFPRYFPTRIPMESVAPIDRAGAWAGAICIVAIFSYMYKENQFYRFFEHILLGLSLGFGTAIIVRQVLIEQWWEPMKNGISAVYSGLVESTAIPPQAIWDSFLVLAAVFGLLWYFQYSKKYLWLSRVVIGVTVGAGAGLGVKWVIMQDFPQVTSTFKSIVVGSELAPHLSARARVLLSAQNLLLIVVVLCVLYYFFFSFRRETLLAKAPARLGRFFLMISFGAFFGNTFMTRVVILIDRVQFLLHDWLRLIQKW